MNQLFLFALIIILIGCSGERSESSSAKTETSPEAITDSIDESNTTHIAINENNLDKAITTQEIIEIDSSNIIINNRSFSLSDIEGAWFDDPEENGLFYIDDSIFYLHANEAFPIWIANDSLLIDYGYDTVGFRITERLDTIRLIPLNDLKEKGLFRFKD